MEEWERKAEEAGKRACSALRPLALEEARAQIAFHEDKVRELRRACDYDVARHVDVTFHSGRLPAEGARHPLFERAERVALKFMLIPAGFEVWSVQFSPTDQQPWSWFVHVHGRGGGISGSEKRVGAGELADAWEEAGR